MATAAPSRFLTIQFSKNPLIFILLEIYCELTLAEKKFHYTFRQKRYTDNRYDNTGNSVYPEYCDKFKILPETAESPREKEPIQSRTPTDSQQDRRHPEVMWLQLYTEKRKQRENDENRTRIRDSHNYGLEEILERVRRRRIFLLHLPERILKSHAAPQKSHHDTAHHHDGHMISLQESFGYGQCEYGYYREQSVHETCSKSCKKSCFMAFTQRFLYYKYSNRPQRDRRANTDKKSFNDIQKHVIKKFIAYKYSNYSAKCEKSMTRHWCIFE